MKLRDFHKCGIKVLPFVIIFLVTIVVFRNFIFKGLLPIPSDILVGAYFPWLDYKWDYPTGVAIKNPQPSDIISILYPWRILGIEIIKSGELPLWESTSLLGMPLLANFQAAILTPINILYFIFTPYLAWSIQIMLQPALIMLTTYLFLKNLKLTWAASLLGSLSFAFSGFSIVWMEYNTIGFTLVFVPLILLYVDKLIEKPRPIYAFLLGLSVCLSILSGYPQISICTIVVSFIYLLFRLLIKRKNLLQTLIFYLIGLLTSVALSALQLLPSIELIRLSIRSSDVTALLGNINYLPLSYLITLFIPDFYGNPATGNYYFTGSYDNFTFYIPIAALFFTIIAVCSKTIFNKNNIIFLLFIMLSLILATNNPINSFIKYLIPGLSSFVAPRAMFITSLSLSIIAAYGLDFILANHKPKPIYFFIPSIIYVTIFIFLLTQILLTSPQYLIFLFNLNNVDYWIKPLTSNIVFRNSIIPLITIFILTIIMLLDKKIKFKLFIIFGLLIFNIIWSTDKYLSFTPYKLLYPPTEILEELGKRTSNHRFDREKGEVTPSNTWVPYQLKAVSGQNALHLMSVNKYLSLVNNNKLDPPSRYIDMTGINSPLYNTLDIQYFLALNRDIRDNSIQNGGEPSPQLTNRFSKVYSFKTVSILENLSNLGIAWYSKSTICNNNENFVVKSLSKLDYDPKLLMIANCPKGNDIFEASVGSVSVIQEKRNYIKFETDNPQDNYLTISKSYYPGWKVYIDGSKGSLYKTNLALMSIFIPQGKHIIKLEYQGNIFYYGLMVSVLTLFIWAIFLCINKIIGKVHDV